MTRSKGASPQLENGYLRLANDLAAAAALASWDSGAQLRMVMALIRVTYGLNRKEADVGTADWRALTGLDEKAIIRARMTLQQQGVLILVRDFDARAQLPARWKLQKDFTRWGHYRVSIDVVAAAEAHAQRLSGTLPPRVTPPPTHGGREQAPPEGGDLPLFVGGALPPSVGGGYAPEPLAPNGSQPPKDIERQERQLATESAPAPEPAPEPALEPAPPPAPVDPEDLVLGITVAANRGMQDNPAIGDRMMPLCGNHASRMSVLEWIGKGIPVDVIQRAVYEAAKAFSPSDRNRQINSFGYFTGPVLEEWDRHQAEQYTPPAVPPRAPTQTRGRAAPPRYDYSHASTEAPAWPT